MMYRWGDTLAFSHLSLSAAAVGKNGSKILHLFCDFPVVKAEIHTKLKE